MSGEAVSKSSTRVGDNLLACGQDDQLLFSAADEQVAVGIEFAQVAGVQPAVADDLIGCGPIVPVTEHDVRAARQDFAVAGDANFDVCERSADGAWAMSLWRGCGDDG